tara:strand:+ start:2833 stop:4566 length:1734 start_codon:yes stop_codon:yes gene_type:complete
MYSIGWKKLTSIYMVKVSIIGKGRFGSKIEESIKDKVEFVEPKDADWIIISTPNDLHSEQVETWLAKKKNIFCEKPLTLTESSARGLFALADFFNVKLYVDDVFSWYSNLNIDNDVKLKWYKYGSFNANIIDNLAYHHFYLWTNTTDFNIDTINGEYYDSTKCSFTVTLDDGRVGNFDYNIIEKDLYHTIDKPINNPLRDMLLSVFNGSVDFESNKKRTLNATRLCESVKKKLYPKVLVVGGGIFGTTSAINLSTNGYNVTLHEELDDIMKCASNINQYRLHKGYHYPRSKDTAKECLVGIKSFKRKYEESVVNGNINHQYAISKRDSLVSSDDYIQFLNEMELFYNEVDILKGTQLTVDVDEELFDSDKLRTMIRSRLVTSGVNVNFNKKTIKDDFNDYDFVVISTYSKINELLDSPRQYQYEVIEKPVVKLPKTYENKSIVVMDGPFMCLDPFKDGLHVLGHVEHAIHSTNIGEYPMVLDKTILKYINNGIIKNPKITKINKFKEAGMEFFEDFDKLEHIGSMFTIRTVLSYRDYDDARPTLVNKEGDKVFSIFSGKIGTCVEASNQLVNMIKGI